MAKTPLTYRLDHKMLDSYEKIWLLLGLVIQVLLFIAVLSSLVSGTSPLIKEGGGAHNHLAGVDNGKLDPTHLEATAFAKPGLYQDEDGHYRAIVVARAFNYEPANLKVPAGVPIDFHVTSADVVHGYLVHGTNINVDLMPGQVTSFSTTFRSPGTYNIICNEYCGAGHHNMLNEITVLPAGQEVPVITAQETAAAAPAETVQEANP